MKNIIYFIFMCGIGCLFWGSLRYIPNKSVIPELNKDTQVELRIHRRENLKISYKKGIFKDKLIINDQGKFFFKDIYLFPASYSYAVYPDSIVVTSVNQHRLTIVFTE